MFQPKCYRCRKVLDDFGALIFSPPKPNTGSDFDDVIKLHICKKCWVNLKLWLKGLCCKEKFMSANVSICLFSEVLKDDSKYPKLLESIKENTTSGHWNIAPCTCNPPCSISRRDIMTLTTRIRTDLKPKPYGKR
jgi:hypothetical protein